MILFLTSIDFSSVILPLYDVSLSLSLLSPLRSSSLSRALFFSLFSTLFSSPPTIPLLSFLISAISSFLFFCSLVIRLSSVFLTLPLPLNTFLSSLSDSPSAASTESGLLMGRVVGVIRRNWRQYAGSLDLGGSGDKEEG